MPKVKQLNPLSDQFISERIHFENTWWLSSKTESEFSSKSKRAYFENFKAILEDRSSRKPIVLMGPTQSGKTVFIQHAIQHLLDKEISAMKIAYIGLGNPALNSLDLSKLVAMIHQASAKQSESDSYIFLDDIHYLNFWLDELMPLVDQYPEVQFVVSSSVNPSYYPGDVVYSLNKVKEFVLPAITFTEYLSIKKVDQLILPSTIEWRGSQHNFYAASNIKELNRQFLEYLNYGSFPQVAYSRSSSSEAMKSLMPATLQKSILSDVANVYGIQNIQELNSLFALLANFTGKEVSLESLSSISGIEKYLLRKYIEYLEAAFLIRVIHRVDEFAQKFTRANYFKVYLTNTAVRTLFFFPVEATDESMPELVSTVIFSQWLHRYRFTPYYARWTQGEISMLGIDERRDKPQGALEIKWTNYFVNQPDELKNLIHFCYQNEMDTAMVTTLDTEAVKEVDELNLHFVPAAIYAYVVGINTLERAIR